MYGTSYAETKESRTLPENSRVLFKTYLPRLPVDFLEGALGAGLLPGLDAAFPTVFAAGLEVDFPAGLLVPGLGGGAP